MRNITKKAGEQNSMERVKVVISDKQKKVKVPSGLRMLIRRCCHAVLVVEKYEGEYEVSVTFIDNKEIHSLNTQYMGKDTDTDVLSFPLGQNGIYDVNLDTGAKSLGDIVISLEKAEVQAKSYEHSFQREVAFLTVHSMLHLLGYEHENGGIAASRMREKEEQILTSLGLARTESYALDED
jgi:probable rRNA maturation factor